MFEIFRRKSIDKLQFDMPFDEIRKRARILVIDDDPAAFPCTLLEKEGYNVRYWEKVENLHDLENGEFDIIVLDIYGVASLNISPNDGLGVLKHIKKHNRAQLVIAYSGHKHDFSQSEFWSLADDYLGKPSSLIECKQKIDDLLKSYFTPQHYWNIAVSMLKEAGVKDKKLRSLERQVINSLYGKPQTSKEMIAQSLSIAHHTAATVWVLIQAILRFYASNP